jgi:arylsulfatase A
MITETGILMMRKCLLIAFLFFSSVAFGQKKTDRPNIIFILADDLGYGDLGCYGQQKIRTPHLDQLSKQGVKFTQFYSGSTVCAPARCTFLTGMHTGHGAIRGNITVKPEGQVPLPDSVVTIAMLLREHGYATAAFGKWSMGFITSSGDPYKKGFDEFYGYNCQTLAHNYYPDHLWHNHDRIDLSGNLKSDSAYSADLIHEQAMKFLRQQHNKPFFLYLPYTLPHADVIAPHDSVYQYYVGLFNEKPVPVPLKEGDGEKHHFDAYPHAAYAAMVERLDRFVGEVMDELSRQGIEENTLVIFTSDNGPHKENGGDPAFFNGSGGFRGIKRDLYEGGIREPFIAYQKGWTKKSVVDQPSVLYDLFPSFLELAGIKNKSNIDGLSLVPLLRGQPAKQHSYFYWELHEAGGKQAVRVGNWKAVRLNVSTPQAGATELYDLKTDPGEKQNLASRYPKVVAQMEAIMKQAYVPNHDWPLFPGENGD